MIVVGLIRIHVDEHREIAYPADMWIVDQTLFRQTYESVAPGT